MTHLYDYLLSTDENGNPQPGGSGSFYAADDVTFTSPLVWYDDADVPQGTTAVMNNKGLFPPYRLGPLNAQFKSAGQPAIPVVSFDGLRLEMEAARASAASSAADAQNAAAFAQGPTDEQVQAAVNAAAKPANIVQDVDGTFYFSPGANEFYLLLDSDGTPYVEPI